VKPDTLVREIEQYAEQHELDCRLVLFVVSLERSPALEAAPTEDDDLDGLPHVYPH